MCSEADMELHSPLATRLGHRSFEILTTGARGGTCERDRTRRYLGLPEATLEPSGFFRVKADDFKSINCMMWKKGTRSKGDPFQIGSRATRLISGDSHAICVARAPSRPYALGRGPYCRWDWDGVDATWSCGAATWELRSAARFSAARKRL